MNARETALKVLLQIETKGAYSNLLLDDALNEQSLSKMDRAFCSMLTRGTIERLLTIDYELMLYLKKPLKKLSPEARTILRMGAFQILFLDKVPDSAAINESVKLSKKHGASYASGLINAVLRNVSKNGLVFDGLSGDELLSVKYSCPLWLISSFREDYGNDALLTILENSIKPNKVILRVNTTKITTDALIALLFDEGISTKRGILDGSLEVTSATVSLTQTDSFLNGLFFVQNYSSQLLTLLCSEKKPRSVLDFCAAPGGKSFSLSCLLGDGAKITSCDVIESRVGLIKSGAERLSLKNIETRVLDATKPQSDLSEFDLCLCDVPCSGFGDISKKPEIKFKSKDEIKGLKKIQTEILNNGANHVRDGGFLVYSTCTLKKSENDEICDEFLASHPEFSNVPLLSNYNKNKYLTIIDCEHSFDGFFVAMFKKENGKN